MFGRLASVRIKAAEDALAQGRIDEALETAISRDLAGNDRVQRLCKSLATAFFERGQERLMSRNFVGAISDFDRAGQCGYSLEKVNEWRHRAQAALAADHAADRLRADALNDARRRADAGSLVGAAEALQRAPLNDPAREALASAIDRQAQQASDALAIARSALERDDLHNASRQIRIAKSLHAKLEGLSETEHRLVDRAVERVRAAFESGRLDRARQDMEVLVDLDCRSAARVEMEDLMRHASAASEALLDHDYSRAALALGRLAKISQNAPWAAEARSHLDTIESAVEAVMEGPLGLLVSAQNRSMSRKPREMPGLNGETLPAVARPPIAREVPHGTGSPSADVLPPTPGLPRRILLRMDGVGSFLLVRGDRVSIGRAGPGATADVQLVSDLSDRHAEIVRAGEDYFVVSQSGVELAGSNVDHALLQDGDRVRLGKRFRLKFRRPSLKSSAALLELGEGVRMDNDCRRVILWSGPVLIGGARECHVPASGGRGDFVLIERGGRMYVKPIGGASEATPVEFGAAIAIGDLRFTASALNSAPSTGRVIG